MEITNLESPKQVYERDGVAVIYDVFTNDEIDRLRAACMGALCDADPDHKYRDGGRLQLDPYGGPALMFWPSMINPVLNHFRHCKRMGDIVAEFLGDSVRQLNNQIYYRLPGWDTFAPHTDAMFRKGMTGTLDIYDYLQTSIVIDQPTYQNGGVYFMRGSHLDRVEHHITKEELRQDVAEPPGAWIPRASPGDVIVWNVYTVHGSRPNRSNASRLSYMNGFAKSSACVDWPDYFDEQGDAIEHVDTDAIPYT